MKRKKIFRCLLGFALMLSSCSDDITAPDSWPEWPERATVSVNDKELTESISEMFETGEIHGLTFCQ